MLAPGMNIARTPYNGRNFEYFGEDPYLASRTAVSVIRGIQDNPVIADAKHYALNNQEIDRMTVDVRASERVMREIYLPAFEASVKKADVGSVMCSYNKVDTQVRLREPDPAHRVPARRLGLRRLRGLRLGRRPLDRGVGQRRSRSRDARVRRAGPGHAGDRYRWSLLRRRQAQGGDGHGGADAGAGWTRWCATSSSRCSSTDCSTRARPERGAFSADVSQPTPGRSPDGRPPRPPSAQEPLEPPAAGEGARAAGRSPSSAGRPARSVRMNSDLRRRLVRTGLPGQVVSPLEGITDPGPRERRPGRLRRRVQPGRRRRGRRRRPRGRRGERRLERGRRPAGPRAAPRHLRHALLPEPAGRPDRDDRGGHGSPTRGRSSSSTSARR